MVRYLDFVRVVIQSPIRHAHQSRLFHDAHEPRANDQWLGGRDDAEQVPAGREADGLLEAASSDVADGVGTGVREEQDGDGRLLEREEETNVGVEARKDNVALLAKVVDFGQDSVHE